MIIMQFFFDLILFLCLFIQYSSSNYTLCTSQTSQITVSFVQPLTIPFDDNTANNYDQALVCIIEYRIDYDAKQIYINFKATNDTDTFKDQLPSDFLIQSIWLGFNQDSNQPNITHRKYGCNTQADCGRVFYLNTIERLITNGQVKLNEIKFNLYDQSIKKRRCKDNRNKGNESLTRCPNGLCYALNIDKKQYCTRDTAPTLFSEIEYHSRKSGGNERELIEYKCNKNFCNGNQMIKTIKNLLLDYTNWNKIHYPLEDKFLLEKTSSTNQQTLSYCLLILSFINLQFLF